MLGYSEENCIFFSIDNFTGYAKLLPEQRNIDSGVFTGLPKFKFLNLGIGKGLSLKAKQFHAAEHKAYKAFKKKIKKLKTNSPFAEFKKYLPSRQEIKQENAFSLLCGTSFIWASSLSTIMMCLPNLFHYKNTDPIFMTVWLFASILVMYLSSYFIQSFYLSPPNNLQIFIAQKALKEVLNGNNHKPSS